MPKSFNRFLPKIRIPFILGDVNQRRRCSIQIQMADCFHCFLPNLLRTVIFYGSN